MNKGPRTFFYRTKSLPIAKVWALIKLIEQKFPITRDRVEEHRNHSKFVISLPALPFSQEDIDIRALLYISADLPKEWHKDKRLKSFAVAYFNSFTSPTETRITSSSSLHSIQADAMVHLFQEKDRLRLHLCRNSRAHKLGPQTNQILRVLIRLSGLPITLEDTPAGFIVHSDWSNPVTPTTSIVTGKEAFHAVDCHYPRESMEECLSTFDKILKSSELSPNELGFYFQYDNPKAGSNVLSGTKEVNALLARLNAISPLPSQVTMAISWSLVRWQDYEKLEDILKIVGDKSNGASLFEFTYRKKPASLDIAASVGGTGFLQLGFLENYYEKELEQEFGTKFEAQ